MKTGGRGGSGVRIAGTLGALVFALASIGWSAWSLRGWWAEHRESRWQGPASGPRRLGGATEDRDEPRPHPTNAWRSLQNPQAAGPLTRAADLFTTTQVWTVHLRLEPDQWAAIEPRQIEPLGRSRGSGGRFELRNPNARRSGLSGVRGLEFDWVRGEVRFEDLRFPDAGIRYKGNGTYLRSQSSDKRPFKVDLNRNVPGASLAGRTTLNFANLVTDDSGLHDALGYELYRAAGVPAPRTAYARLFLSPGAAVTNYLGVYLLVENLDARFAEERFGTRSGVIFKPVTTELFLDLGDDWDSYDAIYDPKTRIEPAQAARVIAFARLLTHADDATFAARSGEFLDLDAFARFVAVTVLLSSYDGFLTNGQNFYLWLDPATERFHFLPWDLDNAWGRFGMVGSARDRAHASVDRPWAGDHRLLERMLAVPGFRTRYRAVLGELLDSVFLPERLFPRVDAMAALLRPVFAEESPRRASRFGQAVTVTEWEESADEPGFGRRRAVHPLKWFIAERAASVRAQLVGAEDGVVLDRWR
ncbi:MAG: CotH kinase family protein [Verrucomicrobia bacterium]|nr:CotH kinase family protein [Verrucomicrobiota bacterium]